MPKPHIHTQEPQALLKGITRASHPSPTRAAPPQLRLESPPVTAPPGASAARPCTNPVRPGDRHGTSSRGGRARERTFRATPFFAHTHRRAHHRSTHPHRLRFARRQQQQQRRQRHHHRGHRPRRPAHRRPVRPRPRHQELRRPRRQAGQREEVRRRRHLQAPGPRRPGPALLRPAERQQARRQQGRPRRRRPPELLRRRIHAEGPRRRQARPGLPANTSPSLTQGQKWNEGTKERPFASYFRTSTTDAVQGPFAAQYLFNDAKKKKVFVIDDKKTYGAGLAGTFKAEFEKLGGTIAGTEHIDPETKDFSSVATKVKSSGADVVYYGGEYPAAGPSASRSRRPEPRSPSSAATASTAASTSSSPAPKASATSPPPSVPPSTPCRPPRSSSRTTRRPATRSPSRPTAATPTTPPGPSSRPSRPSPTPTTASSPATPAPRSPKPSARSTSKA